MGTMAVSRDISENEKDEDDNDHVKEHWKTLGWGWGYDDTPGKWMRNGDGEIHGASKVA